MMDFYDLINLVLCVLSLLVFDRVVCVQWQVESDMHNTCFICSRSSYDFEHQGSVSLGLVKVI